MRGITFIFAAALALTTVAVAPAMAVSSVCAAPSGAAVAPSVAAQALQSSLPSGVTMGSATEAQVIAAYKDASSKNEGYAGALASIVAVGRPDLVAALSSAVKEICPSSADVIIQQINESASNPTADQLAAIAASEGVAPAAGGEGDAGPDGSNQ